MSEPVIGEFVNLRPLRVEDAELTFRWRHAARARLLNRSAETIEQQARWIAARGANEYNFIIETKHQIPVGMLALSDVDRVNCRAEPGRFLIGDEEATKGIPAAAEATKLLYDLAFDRLELRRLHGTVAADNVLMIKWQTYLGMIEEGRLRDHYFIDGRFQDAVVFGLLESEYRRGTRARLEGLVAAGRLQVAHATGSEQA